MLRGEGEIRQQRRAPKALQSASHHDRQDLDVIAVAERALQHRVLEFHLEAGEGRMLPSAPIAPMNITVPSGGRASLPKPKRCIAS